MQTLIKVSIIPLMVLLCQTSYGFVSKSQDTVFLQDDIRRIEDKGKVYISRSVVYIDPNPSSKQYEYIGDFDIEAGTYYAAFSSPVSIKTTPDDLPLEWLPLFVHKGEYYLYSPCEWVIQRYKITDTTLVWYGWMDGVYGFNYQTIDKEGENQFHISGVQGAHFTEMNIYIVDPKKGIAIFETNENEKYTLKIRADKAHLFPVIVCECDDKDEEYEFEKPNYLNLLEKFNRKPSE